MRRVATILLSQVGTVVRWDGGEAIHVERGQKGCVVYAPYIVLAPGEYEAEFNISVAAPSRNRCCVIDVNCFGQDIVASKPLTGQVIKAAKNTITLPFKVEKEGPYELRVFTTGESALTVAGDRPVKMTSSRTSGATEILNQVEFYRSHFGYFHDLSIKGFRFRPAGGRVVCMFSGLSFTIENVEDFQIVQEVFLTNEYNVALSGDIEAIDIGMNVGYTSLSFAKMDNVRKVHAFEPFAGPFERAKHNFSLNKGVGDKIFSHRLGLSDEDRTDTVLSSSETSISVSVRGSSHGNAEQIVLRDASRVLGPVIAEARQQGRRIVLKVDCEGSEFAVFRSLEASGLLSSISAIACEWHKWWSKDHTVALLTKPLLEHGFIVVDRTNPNDPYAGFFYAMRTI